MQNFYIKSIFLRMFKIFVEVTEEKRYNYILWVFLKRRIVRNGAAESHGYFMA